jgi:hypothetical protein
MTDEAEEENQQFEQVLSRLDALMKRSHPGAPPSSPEPEPESEPEPAPAATGIYFHLEPIGPTDETDAVPEDAEADPAALVQNDAAAIPVLTEIYAGGVPAVPMPETPAAAAVEELSPELLESIRRIVDEECDNLRRTLGERLQSEVIAALRQR